MISRRVLLLASSSYALLMVASPVAASDGDFICSTPEPELLPGQLGEIDDFGTDDFNGTIDDFVANLREKGITEYGTGMVSDTWRRRDGLTPGTGKISLGVAFIDGDDQQKAAVRTHAVKWLTGDLGRVLDFRFDVPREQAQISITFNTTLNKSLIGRSSRDVAKSQATMHLSQAIERSICHEFGHALGLRHEHSNPNGDIQWNEPVVIADMAAQNWTADMVRANIFKKFGPEYACIGDPGFNTHSIMLYPIKRSWTLNGFSVPLNEHISDGDEKCLVALYNAG